MRLARYRAMACHGVISAGFRRNRLLHRAGDYAAFSLQRSHRQASRCLRHVRPWRDPGDDGAACRGSRPPADGGVRRRVADQRKASGLDAIRHRARGAGSTQGDPGHRRGRSQRIGTSSWGGGHQAYFNTQMRGRPERNADLAGEPPSVSRNGPGLAWRQIEHPGVLCQPGHGPPCFSSWRAEVSLPSLSCPRRRYQ